MDIEFVGADAPLAERSALALVVLEGEPLGGEAGALDARTGGAVSRALGAARFTGAKGQVLDLLGLADGGATRILLVGAGKVDALDDIAIEHAAASAYNAVKTSGLAVLRLRLPDAAASRAIHAGLGARLAAYRFDRYRTKEPAEKKPTVVRTQVVAADPEQALSDFAPLADLADAIAFSRDLVSEPANILYPVEFARRVKELERLGLEVEILGEAEMAKLGMGSLLGVGQGSIRESQLVVIRWNGAEDKSAQPVAFVGKGVCFDTGGISIKPADGMEDMK
jgi:leucyl aminopeptidase